jgi:hypothetical protein
MMSFGFGIFFFIFNCGPFVFSENRKFLAKLANLTATEEEKSEVAQFGKQ